MKTVAMSLHCRTDGTYRLSLTVWEDGEGIREVLAEESNPMPEVAVSDAWGVASQMAQEALRALEPSPSLWGAAGAFRTE